MKIAVIGHGGHSKVIYDIISSNKEKEVVGFLDDKYKEVALINNTFYGPIAAAQNLLDHFQDIKFVIAIGDNKIRQSVVQRLNIPIDRYATVKHKTAVVSESAVIGKGTVVMPNAVVNANAEIGLHSIINTGAVIEHDCKVGNFVHVCPNAALTGAVCIEDGVFIGAGTTIIPNIKIGEGAVIGAGSTVVRDIPPYFKAMGVPAKMYKLDNKEGKALAESNSY